MTTLWNDLKEDLKPSKILVATFTSDRAFGCENIFVAVENLNNLEILKNKCQLYAHENFGNSYEETEIVWKDKEEPIIGNIYIGGRLMGYFPGWFEIFEFEIK